MDSFEFSTLLGDTLGYDGGACDIEPQVKGVPA